MQNDMNYLLLAPTINPDCIFFYLLDKAHSVCLTFVACSSDASNVKVLVEFESIFRRPSPHLTHIRSHRFGTWVTVDNQQNTQ